MSKLFLLTLTWNNAEKLLKLKESLMPSLSNIDYKWIIRDNDSKDNTEELVKSWDCNIEYIKHPNNLSNFSEGMNDCFSKTNANDDDLILLLNNDVVFNDKTSIKNMMNLIEKDNNIGVVGCRMYFTGTKMLQHAGVIFMPTHRMPIHFRAGQGNDKFSDKDREFQAVTGAVLLTKAKYFKEVCKDNKSGLPGLDEKFNWAFDDVDLCLSIKYNMNKKIVYCANTNIFHEESASLKKNPINKLYLLHNVSLLKNKWGARYIDDAVDYHTNHLHKVYKK